MTLHHLFAVRFTVLVLVAIPLACTSPLDLPISKAKGQRLENRAFGLPPSPLPNESSDVTESDDTALNDAQAEQKPLPHLILPATRSSKDDTDRVYTDLVSKAKDTHPIFSKSDDNLGVIFWTALLTPSDADELKRNHPILTSVAEDKIIPLEQLHDPEPGFEKRTIVHRKRDEPGEVIKQSNAPQQLKVISQPGKEVKVGDLRNFAYREEAGRGVTVYIFDEGANKQHSEWTGQPGAKKWIFPGNPNDPRYTIDTTETDKSETSHGSCVYSMAVGPRFGVAKNADVVIVKHAIFNREDSDDSDEEDTVESATLDGMAMILADVKGSELKKKAVVNLSFGVSEDIEDASRDKIHDLIEELLANDVVVVTASGNERNSETGARSDIDDYPALFREDIQEMIVVGATNNEGTTWPSTQGGDLLDLSGPGDSIVCAKREGDGLTIKSGTSYAAASVSGLAAYFLSLPELSDRLKVDGKTAQNVKDIILEKAYPRIDGEVKVLYNNEKSDLNT
ncbi:MAG: hypothetical protein Q9171_005143 [Xanthocarpia ochracea]